MLIVSFLFPPANAVGAVRVGKLAKYLPQFGWEPIVLTAKEVKERPQTLPVEIDEANIFKTPYFALAPSFYRKLGGDELASPRSSPRNYSLKRTIYRGLSLARPIYTLSIFQWLFSDPIGWYRHAVKKGREILNTYDIDAIFSSYGPSTSHLVASRLQRVSEIPWIAEFRDLWALNPNARTIRFFQFLEERLEKRVMKGSSLLIAASEPMAEQLEMLHAKKAVTIHNGFDEEDYTEEVPSTAKFTITYTGRIYPGKHDPSPLFEAVRDLQQEGAISADDFEIRFFGPNVVSSVTPLIERHKLQGLVNVYDSVPFKESIVSQKESSVLLLLKWNDPAVKGIYSGKLFEYFGAQRPILAVGAFADEFVDKLLTESGTGVAPNDKHEIKTILSRWLEEFRRSGEIASGYNPNRDVIAQYTRKEQAKKLAQALDEVSTH